MNQLTARIILGVLIFMFMCLMAYTCPVKGSYLFKLGVTVICYTTIFCVGYLISRLLIAAF